MTKHHSIAFTLPSQAVRPKHTPCSRADCHGPITTDALSNKMSSPPSDAPLTPAFYLGGLKSFLPLSDDSSLSTRGQHLPQLIQSRSSNNVFNDQQRSPFTPSRSAFSRRRPSSIRTTTAHGRQGEDNDVEAHTDAEDHEGVGRESRRKSNAPSALMTPEMRSQRLIGNSNPRYRW